MAKKRDKRFFIGGSYTPGPWDVYINMTDGLIVRCKEGLDVTLVTCNPEQQDDEDMTRANARLIAAAPELLEQLAWFTRCARIETQIGGAYIISDEEMEIARQLIKKVIS